MRRNALGLSRVYVLVLGLIALAFFLLCSELHGVQAPQGSLSAPFQLDPSGPGAWEPGRSRGGVLCGPGSISRCLLLPAHRRTPWGPAFCWLTRPLVPVTLPPVLLLRPRDGSSRQTSFCLAF